jgi:exopolyphosphatase/guanosine-5'-triphosphate,3'-diphosphate pyrophosphatase
VTLETAPNGPPRKPRRRRRRGRGARSNGAAQNTANGTDIYGALDLGSNNCRLLVARPVAEGFRVIDAFSRIVRLGEGVAETGRLSDAAMDRTLAALEICASKLRRRGVTRFRGVATEACRQAENCDAFVDRAAREAGVELEIITGFEEVELALNSCTPLLEAAASHALLFDIGGCSTELIWVRLADGATPALADWASLPCGVVTLAERHGGDHISAETYEAMVTDASDLVAPFIERLGVDAPLAAGSLQLLGTSGTVTTLAGLHQGLRRYDRAKVDGFLLGFDDVRRQIERLLEMDFKGRAAEPCIGAGRGDVVVAGCAILEAVLRACPAPSVHVADRGLREGMLLGMMRADAHAI